MVNRGEGEETEKVKGVKYMGREGNQTSGGEHTMEYTGVLL